MDEKPFKITKLPDVEPHGQRQRPMVSKVKQRKKFRRLKNRGK